MQVSSATSVPLVDLGIFNNPVNSNKLEIRVRPNGAVNNGNYSAGTFVIRYPTAYNVTLSVFSAAFGYGPTFGSPYTSGIYTYYVIYFSGSNSNINWTAGQEVVAIILQISNTGSGFGNFELTTDTYASSITGGFPFYQELSGNGMFSAPSGQQGVFYNNSPSAPLPVELSSFNATALPDRTVGLDWSAAVERNLSYYDVEHSNDGTKFSQLDKMEAIGTVSKPAIYSYIHKDPKTGTNYYRLKMVDYDGAFNYSPIRTVEFQDNRNNFTLRPTPTTGPLALMSANLDQYPAGLKYQLTDNTGKLLQTDQIINEKTDFNLSKYAAGIYYLTVFTDQEQLKQFKVIVTRD